MIFEKIRDILAEQLGVDAEDISLETNIMKDLEADSLDVVEIIMAIEDEFEIEIPDEDAEQLQTVAGIVKYIEDKE
ncbi:MAG: acyl carrier protein [Clostridia bacterium]|nr:acyl carrier protein [Clostridia bacterium]